MVTPTGGGGKYLFIFRYFIGFECTETDRFGFVRIHSIAPLFLTPPTLGVNTAKTLRVCKNATNAVPERPSRPRTLSFSDRPNRHDREKPFVFRNTRRDAVDLFEKFGPEDLARGRKAPDFPVGEHQ